MGLHFAIVFLDVFHVDHVLVSVVLLLVRWLNKLIEVGVMLLRVGCSDWARV